MMVKSLCEGRSGSLWERCAAAESSFLASLTWVTSTLQIHQHWKYNGLRNTNINTNIQFVQRHKTPLPLLLWCALYLENTLRFFPCWTKFACTFGTIQFVPEGTCHIQKWNKILIILNLQWWLDKLATWLKMKWYGWCLFLANHQSKIEYYVTQSECIVSSLSKVMIIHKILEVYALK